MFPHFAAYTDYALLFLRFMVGLIFADSGFRHLKDPDARSKSIELPKPIVILLGCAELLGGVAIIVGVLPQLAAIGTILILIGAIDKKIFSWKTGFWGKDGLGWNYELILVSMLLVIACTDGGRFVLTR